MPGTLAEPRDIKDAGKCGVEKSSYASRESPMSSTSRAVTLCGAVVALAVGPATGRAQTIPFDPNGFPVRIGAHLRVRGQGEHSSVFKGRLESMSSDSINIALDS